MSINYKPKKMKPEIKEKWVRALRSGEYTQGKLQLRTKNDEFCCLGVLCNIHAQDVPTTASKETIRTKYLGSTTFLPDEVMIWAGVERNYGALVRIDKKLDTLAYHNDSGVNFDQIADAIEREL